MRQTHDPTPKSRMRILPLLWVSWAVVCLGAVLTVGFLASEVILVSQSQVYVGTLQPNQTPVKLRLPAGVPLRSVLVKSGETVRAGQTVALLDVAAMRAQLLHIDRSIVVANVLRACLLQTGERTIPEAASGMTNLAQVPFEMDVGGVDLELGLLILAAQADCATGQREDQTDLARVERALTILQDRLSLINQKLSMILGVHVQEVKRTVPQVLRAHASVSVALERNDLVQRIQTLSTELSMLRAAQDRVRLTRVTQLSQDVAQKLTQQAVLETYVDSPRLTVPNGGRVSRVRPIPAGTQFDISEILLEVSDADADQYIADLRVPLAQVTNLPVGTPVTVSLAGFTQNGPRLDGKIARWSEADSLTGHHFALARINLSEDSQSILSDPRNGVALRGTTTASVIRAELHPSTLQSTLKDSVYLNFAWLKEYSVGALHKLLPKQHPKSVSASK